MLMPHQPPAMCEDDAFAVWYASTFRGTYQIAAARIAWNAAIIRASGACEREIDSFDLAALNGNKHGAMSCRTSIQSLFSVKY